ncbi:kinase-like domain-containing protein [Jimgerdemannia flammicorona]|uniref:Kinase-like domain-containing protein n=1 Tax=Jimgerdemannia flammicorona TaxID=994334 RepID=A0A433QJF8_9FUNG|nr:kinase-like domain-containing protein [Jimgerdemannia flammicorona]
MDQPMDQVSAARHLFAQESQHYAPEFLERVRKANNINFPPPSGQDPDRHLDSLGVPELRNIVPYIPPERLSNPCSIGRGGFAELLHMARMQGPGHATSVMGIMGVSQFKGKYVIVMECANGGNLSKYRSLHHPKNWAGVCLTLETVARRLEELHLTSIIHGDLHPGNVVFHNGHPYLIDVGLSVTVNSARTNYGAVKYLPPEAFREEPLTLASDVYCFGTLAWQLIVGVQPRGTAETFGEDGLREEPIPGCPSGLQRILKECWALDPQDRPTALELRFRLSNLAWYYSIVSPWGWSTIPTETTEFIKMRQEIPDEDENNSSNNFNFADGNSNNAVSDGDNGSNFDFVDGESNYTVSDDDHNSNKNLTFADCESNYTVSHRRQNHTLSNGATEAHAPHSSVIMPTTGSNSQQGTLNDR